MSEKLERFIANPRKALFILAMPMMIAMLVQVMYNIVDTAFVGRLGADALAAITFSFPLFFILIAMNSGVSTGMSALVSKAIGAKDKDLAENIAVHGVVISLVVSLVIFILGTFSLDWLFSVFGASGSILQMAKDYMRIILAGVFFMFTLFTLGSIFSAQGDTKTQMKVQIFSLLLNMVLDYLFIFKLEMGIKGAAYATLISFGMGLLLTIYYLKKKSTIKVCLRCFKHSKQITKDIFKIGFPMSLMMIILSIYVIFLNRFMVHFGTEYVAAFGIASRLESVAMLPILGISVAMLTLVAMFHGAKKHDLVKSTSWYGMKVAVLITLGIGLVMFIIPEFFFRIFTDDPVIIDIGSRYLMLDVLTFPLMAIGTLITRVMQALGDGMPTLVIQLIRVFGVAIPLSYLFVYVFNFGYLSIAVAMIMGGLVSSLVGVLWLNIKLKKIAHG